MDKRIEGKDRLGEGGPQDGEIGSASDHRQQQEGNEPNSEIGVGGQRHEQGSSRDPASQGKQDREANHG